MGSILIIMLCIGFIFGYNGTLINKTRAPDLTCGEGNYLINLGDQFFCVECPRCPFGMELEVKCDVTKVQPHTINVECLFCKKGFVKTTYDHTSCRPCRVCPNHFKVKSTYDTDRDMICSDQECEQGYEFDPNLVQCLSQSPVVVPSIPILRTQQDCSHTKSGIKKNYLCVITVAKEKCNDHVWIINHIGDRLNPLIFMLSFMTVLSIAIFIFVCYLVCMLCKQTY